ncbi:MAG: guanylate kinase [Alphaproteobacteria bacterium]|nr:guanylate kinase [Alphaproteobacteria bacterium]
MTAITNIKRRGMMLVLSSPSGAGKTTLAKRLLETDRNFTMSVSVTTRAKRPSEVEGQDYHFITADTFAEKVKRDELLEFATVFGNSYGTPRAPVEQALAQGRDILFDIDWQGTQQLKEKAREDVVSIFILPPSRAELERRLKSRAQDSAETVAKRMAKANDEISHWAEYDYVIVNDDIGLAEARIADVVLAERLKRARQTGLSDFVRTLMA